jgi:phosphatidylglycerol lysyltransferase
MGDDSTDGSWETARDLVLRHGWNATAYQLLNPGMHLWFSAAGDAVVGYVDFGRTRVVAGAPVCSAERLPEVAQELEASTNAGGRRVLYFGAGERLERLYADSTHHRLVQLGAQPVWDPRQWTSVVRGKASLRAQLNRARNKHVVVEEWPLTRARESPALREVLRTWLATRGLPALGFMVTTDLLRRGDDRRVFVAIRDSDTVVGFLVATPVPARSGWLVEEWPRVPTAPNGTTHLMVDAAMRAFAELGSSYATLGLAPLSSRGASTLAPPSLWLDAVLRWVRAHGRRFYNFAGLESFKASLQPAGWEPVFAVAQGTRFSPRMLRAVAGVFSGGAPELLVARAVLSAARQEVRRMLTRIASERVHAGTSGVGAPQHGSRPRAP